MESLEEISQSIWQELRRGKSDNKHPFRFGTLATMNNNFPNLRTVVLRKIEETNSEIWLYTDLRSPKVEEIRNNSNIAWHFYHSKQQIQLRMYGKATIIHNNKITNEIWQNLPEYGKDDYLTQQAPSTIKKDNTTRLLSTDNSENFCVIITKINKIDWLQLSRNGHQRAKFELTQGDWRREWLIP